MTRPLVRSERTSVRRAKEPDEPTDSKVMGWCPVPIPFRTRSIGGQEVTVIALGNYNTVLVRLPDGRTVARSRRAMGW